MLTQDELDHIEFNKRAVANIIAEASKQDRMGNYKCALEYESLAERAYLLYYTLTRSNISDCLTDAEIDMLAGRYFSITEEEVSDDSKCKGSGIGNFRIKSTDCTALTIK